MIRWIRNLRGQLRMLSMDMRRASNEAHKLTRELRQLRIEKAKHDPY